MSSITVEHTLPAPPEAVFAAVADIQRQPEINPDVLQVRFLSPRTSGAGTRFVETRRMGKKTRDFELAITEYDAASHRLRTVCEASGITWDTVMTVRPRGCRQRRNVDENGGTEMKNAKSTPWAIGCLLLIASPAAAQKRPQKALAKDARIVLLHHSVGGVIWKAGVKAALARHNARHGTRYQIDEKPFPKSEPYGWHNNPYDYWTIWVKHAGPRPYKTEPTLEMLTRRYQVIVLKHCFTVSDMVAGNRGDVASSKQSLANYKLQYEALKKKMRAFPATRFIVWTGPAHTRGGTVPPKAKRARAFAEWVTDSWDEPGDNIYIWDFRRLETAGKGLYLKADYAKGQWDSHPNASLARRAAPLLTNRIVDVIEGRADSRDRTGKGGSPSLD